MTNARIVGYGLILWLIPFAVAVPLMGRDGVPWVGLFLFKSIMLVVGSAVGIGLLRKAFARAGRDYAALGLRTALIWTVMQWVLDAAILLPLSGQSIGDYIRQIGLGYLSIALVCGYGGAIAQDAAGRVTR